MKWLKNTSFNYFLEATESPYPAAWFRISAASFILLNLFVLRNSFSDLYGSTGFMNWEATRPLIFKYSITAERIFSYLKQFGISQAQVVNGLYYSFVICSVSLVLGLFTRVAAISAWLISFILAYTGKGTFYGMPIFIHVSLFYLIIFPSNAVLSLDARFRKGVRKEKVRSFTRKLLQIHMAVVYASSGLEKVVGEQWWNGEAIWRSLNMSLYMQYDMTWMAYYPFVPLLIGWGTLVLEIGYPILIWVPRVRTIWMALTILLHIGIVLFMGLQLFGLIMIILNLGAFGPEVYKDIKGMMNKKRGLRPKPAEADEMTVPG